MLAVHGRRYSEFAELLDTFQVEIGPVFHRLPERSKAHAAICFIALILYRVMRQRLSSADAHLSPERALAELQKLQHHQILINQADRPVTGISRFSETQDRVFAALRLKKTDATTAPFSLVVHVFESWFKKNNNLRV